MSQLSPPPADAARLADEITLLGAQINAATCRWLGLVAAFDACDGHLHWGQASCADWVAWRCSMSPATAREHVRVARWLAGQPEVRECFARGELSFSKVRALSRLGPLTAPADALAMAREATAAQLERIVAATRRVGRDDAARAQADRHLDLYIDDDGCAVLRARIPGEDGALVLRALEAALERLADGDRDRDGRGVDDVSAETREPQRARNADALVLLADTALAAADAERTGGDRHQVVVHVDVATLAATEAQEAAATDGRAGPHTCRLAEGAAIAAETARRLACDASIVAALERDGATLSVGRKRRSIPPAIRRALRRRDACCAFPGCTRTRWLDAHHIEHWAHGGHTSLDNLVHLCHHHHQLVHEGGWTLARGADGAPVVTSPQGRRLAAAVAPRRGSCDRMLARQQRDGTTPSLPALAEVSRGARFDLGLAVDELLTATAAPPGPPAPPGRATQ